MLIRGGAILSSTAAFTLAEVLITLGIIGVVAALTIPVLVQNYRNTVAEKRLQKFYSAINQALIRAEVDFGDKKLWYQPDNSIDVDEEGKPVNGSASVEKWWNTYISPYMKTIAVKHDAAGLPIFYFPDGTALKPVLTSNTQDWMFYITSPEKCEKFNPYKGVCAFMFIYMPGGAGAGYEDDVWSYHKNKGFEPYKYGWDGDVDSLYKNDQYGYACYGTAQQAGNYCTAIIQTNGWKIPNDYPLKIRY